MTLKDVLNHIQEVLTADFMWKIAFWSSVSKTTSPEMMSKDLINDQTKGKGNPAW